MDEVLKTLGYRINYEKLHREYTNLTGQVLTQECVRFYECVAPHLVLAYEAGHQNRELTKMFAFLEAC